VAVLHMGELQQCDTPQYLYEHPDNIFVAAFIGSPAMNLYEATVSPEADAVKVGGQNLSLPESALAARPALRGYRDRKVIVGIRPEDLEDPALGPAPAPGTTMVADVELVEALGNELQVHFLTDATKARSEVTQAAQETEELGDLASLQMGEARAEGVARISPRSDFRAGSRVTMAVRTDQLHFFDPDTGRAIWD
jgi:multiple sugar transport system ATP-binding protein